MPALVELDGSHGEGGGAILRTALALSTATGVPFRIKNIRANRPQPGLKQQHIVGVRALMQWSGAKVTDCHPGSTELMFIPGKDRRPSIVIDAGTAAPVTLILQSLLPAIAHHGKRTRIVMTGGTDVKWAPPIDYFAIVFAKGVNSLIAIETKVLRRGYFPKGQGRAEIVAVPRRKREPLKLVERGNFLRFAGISHAAFPLEVKRVALRQAMAARISLQSYVKEHGDYPITIDSTYSDTASPGSGITLWAEYENIRIGGDALGELTKIAEKVGEEAAQRLLATMEQDGAVDSWLADQLIPYLALFGGEITTTEVTKHALSNIKVCEAFLPVRFVVEKNHIRVEQLPSD